MPGISLAKTPQVQVAPSKPRARHKGTPASRKPAAPLPALPRIITHILYPALIILAAAFLAIHPITDSDFWHHSAFGREVLRARSIPRADLFSYTASGHQWISSGWFPAMVLHWLYKVAGAAGPVTFVFFTVSAGALTTFFVGRRRYAVPSATALLLLVAMLASYPRFNPRPDILSQFMVVPLILLLCSTERAALQSPASVQKRLCALPFLFAFWANLHALFFLGLAVVGLYAIWRAILWRRTKERAHLSATVPCALCSVSWLLNPYGWRIVQFVYDNATLPKIGERVYELKPLLTAETLGGGMPLHILAAIGLLIVAAAILYWQHRRAIPLWRAGTLALFVFLLFYQRRQIGLAGAAIPALLLPNLAQLETLLRRRKWVFQVLFVVGVTVICLMRFAGMLEISHGLPKAGVDCQWFPCGAAEFLKRNPAPPQLFHDLYTGGYLLHELGPEQKVFIDGRLELYKYGAWQDYFAPPEGRMTSAQLFTKYNVQTAVLDIRGAHNNPGHLASQLLQRPDWLPVYFDDQYCAMVRNTTATKSYLQQHGFKYLNPLHWERLGSATAKPARDEVLREADRALAVAPKSAAANTAMALVQYNLGNRVEGDKYLKAAQAIDPTIQLSAGQ